MRILCSACVLAALAAGCSSDAPSTKTSVAREAALLSEKTTNGVTASLSTTSDWGAGYCASVTLTNKSTAAVTNWALVIGLNQSTVSQIWSATSTTSGSQMAVAPVSYAQSIAPGTSTSFGFCGTATGTNYLPTLVSLSVTGGQTSTGTGGASGAGGGAAGGATSTGGSRAASGGATPTGGNKSTGGATQTGGTAATGGNKSTGGAAATGGSSATAGSSSIAMCTADTSGKTKFCNPNSDSITGINSSGIFGGVNFVGSGSSIAISTSSPVATGMLLTGLSPYNTGDCAGAGVKAVSLATSQPYTGLSMSITNKGTLPEIFSIYIDDLASGGQFVRRKYSFPAVPADATAHSYNLTWSSTFTDSCTLPSGSSFDQNKILGFGFGVEASTTPVQINLLVTDIKFTGGGASAPCTGYCSNPKDFTLTGSYSSGSLGSSAFCYQTTSNISGGNCGNLVSPRTLFINGTAINCSAFAVPAKVNGGYCFYGNAGDYAWAYFGAW